MNKLTPSSCGFRPLGSSTPCPSIPFTPTSPSLHVPVRRPKNIKKEQRQQNCVETWRMSGIVYWYSFYSIGVCLEEHHLFGWEVLLQGSTVIFLLLLCRVLSLLRTSSHPDAHSTHVCSQLTVGTVSIRIIFSTAPIYLLYLLAQFSHDHDAAESKYGHKHTTVYIADSVQYTRRMQLNITHIIDQSF